MTRDEVVRELRELRDLHEHVCYGGEGWMCAAERRPELVGVCDAWDAICDAYVAGRSAGRSDEREDVLWWAGTFPETSSVRLLMARIREGTHVKERGSAGGKT